MGHTTCSCSGRGRLWPKDKRRNGSAKNADHETERDPDTGAEVNLMTAGVAFSMTPRSLGREEDN